MRSLPCPSTYLPSSHTTHSRHPFLPLLAMHISPSCTVYYPSFGLVVHRLHSWLTHMSTFIPYSSCHGPWGSCGTLAHSRLWSYFDLYVTIHKLLFLPILVDALASALRILCPKRTTCVIPLRSRHQTKRVTNAYFHLDFLIAQALSAQVQSCPNGTHRRSTRSQSIRP